ncbi:MAG: hypothetical protein UY99_C0005G0030 [Parcubacteria group bacterium GW2011_GWA1_59_11]|nr:MAG: hypothetical protein UY99_C0005G0030 [Parcubacteria group bacterium GW2011_GWA1_59_11]
MSNIIGFRPPSRMFQIIKIMGIPASSIPSLHEAVAKIRRTAFREVQVKTGRGGVTTDECVRIISSRLDEEYGTYTVEIELDMAIWYNGIRRAPFDSDGEDWNEDETGTYYLSQDLPLSIYRALGVYPEKPEIVPDEPVDIIGYKE